MHTVGKSVQRVDAVAKVRGQAKYVDDLVSGDVLVAKVFRSTIANGWVKRIDVSKARALPGVELVVTYEDVPEHCFPTAGHPWHLDPSKRDIADRNLLTRRIRFYGDEIAAVVAVDELTAKRALELIEVEYEEYEPIITVEDALKEGVEELHPGTGNILKETEWSWGDLDAAFKKADYVFEDEFKTQRVQHCHLECPISYAYQESDGRVVVVSSTQIPHIIRRIVAQALGIPWGKVRVIKPYIGGGFGNKQDALTEPLNAFLATKLPGRVVKLEYTREETFYATRTRHPIDFKIRTGVMKDGTVVARELVAVSAIGGYASHGHDVIGNAGNKFRHLYQHEAIRYKATTVYTTTPVTGAMRSYGIAQVNFAMESHMEDVARALNMDPIEFKEKNLVQEGWQDPLSGNIVRTNGLRECIKRGKELIRWDEKKALYKNQTGPKRRGLGMAVFSYNSGRYPLFENSAARIVMNQDGSVQLQIGATEIGQGSDTIFAQMVADTIGLPVDMVHIVSTQDTDVSPFDTGSYASRQTYVSGRSVVKAAGEIKRKVLERVHIMTGIPASAFDIVDGWVVYANNQERVMPVEDAAMHAYYDPETSDPITADVTDNCKSSSFPFGCTFVEVEVDMPLGKVEILEIYNIHDSGQIINPQLAEGQVHGGVSMGLGQALSEELLIDPKTGRPLNPNLLDYKLGTIMDTPDIGVEFVETYEPTGPFGAKAIGETPAISPMAAIRNAILDATGVKINELPMNPQRLVEKFKAAGLI
ncbi:MAG TPA: xanthine dehydrogenase molybdenum-binding subunit XdhA [Clostridia bacterium]|nr:xanthine dehydrogenase molybdenum-binding subunit XdhA [Clostridia bacterium]